MQVKKAICTWCKGKCGVDVHLDDHGYLEQVKIISKRGFAGGAYGSGCQTLRYRRGPEWFYSPYRLRYPMRRAGARGDNKWQRISWTEALDEIAQRLAAMRDAWGAEALVASAGDNWTHDEYKQRFLSLFGSPNIFGAGPICFGPRSLVSEAVVGWYPAFSLRETTRCILCLGVQPKVARPANWITVQKAKSQGARLVTLDPRRSEVAKLSDVWLPVRPGTDAAVLLGMINHIIEQRLYDKDFTSRWCYGFEALRQRAAEYPLTRVEDISGVPASLIREAAVTYATNRPGAIIEGMGVEQSPNAAQILHARACLSAIVGNYDVEGGDELPGPPRRFRTDRQMELVELLSRGQRAKQIAHDRFRLHSMPGQELLSDVISRHYGKRGGMHWYTGEAHMPSVYRAIVSEKPYPIRAGIFTASNPLVSHANTRLVYEAIKKLDLVVNCDLFWQPTALLADYVLPITSWLERPAIHNYVGFRLRIAGSAAAMPPVTEAYDRRTDFDFWRGLGVRLGQAEHWPWESLEESYDERLRETGKSFAELADSLGQEFPQEEPTFRKYEQTGFATPTGKVELYSTVFEQLGYPPLPYYEHHPDSPARAKGLKRRYPLTIINGSRNYWYMLSDWRQVPEVRQKRPFPLLEVHPDTARRLGLQEDDWAWVENSCGRIIQRVTVFSGLKPDVVHADGQWWYPELGPSDPGLYGVWLSNINLILDDDPARCSEVLGTWPLKQTCGRVYKADTPADAKLIAVLERLCLGAEAKGEAAPEIDPEEMAVIRHYSDQAISAPQNASTVQLGAKSG